MKECLKYALIMCFCVFLAGCSDDKKDEPQLPENAITEERYNNEISNRLWKCIDKEWISDDGVVLPDMDYIIGGYDAKYYFYDKGCVAFVWPALYSINLDNDISFENGKVSISGMELLSLEDGVLYLRTDKGHWMEDPRINPDATWREDVWSYEKYVEVEDPDLEHLFQVYRPSGFDPADLGF